MTSLITKLLYISLSLSKALNNTPFPLSNTKLSHFLVLGEYVIYHSGWSCLVTRHTTHATIFFQILNKGHFMIVNKQSTHRVNIAIHCSDVTLSANHWGSQSFAMLSNHSYIVCNKWISNSSVIPFHKISHSLWWSVEENGVTRWNNYYMRLSAININKVKEEKF